MQEVLLARRTHSRSRTRSNRKVCNNLVFIENCCEAARESQSTFFLCMTSYNTLFLWALKVSCFRIYRCSSWFKTRIRDRQHPADDNGMHRWGAITAIQYPEHKVLPNLTQGHKHIWTHEWGHKLRGARFISFPSAPAQRSPPFILDFVFWSRIFVSSLSLLVKNSLQKEHRGTQRGQRSGSEADR